MGMDTTAFIEQAQAAGVKLSADETICLVSMIKRGCDAAQAADAIVGARGDTAPQPFDGAEEHRLTKQAQRDLEDGKIDRRTTRQQLGIKTPGAPTRAGKVARARKGRK